jgi:hypothetical protein
MGPLRRPALPEWRLSGRGRSCRESLPAAGPFLGAHIPIFKETRMIPLRDSVRSRTFPFVNILLILANAGAFIYELSLPSSALE